MNASRFKQLKLERPLKKWKQIEEDFIARKKKV